MSEAPYIPAGGVSGRLQRLPARLLARRPMAIRLNRPIVSITFDDFPRSAATAGKDALEARGWRGTYYASGCYAGVSTHLGRMYDAGDLQRLLRDGHEVGCHTFTHFDAARADAAEVESDVERNAVELASWGHTMPLSTFAFPYGEASPASKKALMGRFRALRSVCPGINRDGADRALLKAVGIDGGEAGISKAVDYAELNARDPGWLIFYAHEVQENPTHWGCTPAQLDRVFDAIADSGAEVLPVGEALDRLGA